MKNVETENLKGTVTNTGNKITLDGTEYVLVEYSAIATFNTGNGSGAKLNGSLWVSDTKEIRTAKMDYNDDNSPFIRTDKIGGVVDPQSMMYAFIVAGL